MFSDALELPLAACCAEDLRAASARCCERRAASSRRPPAGAGLGEPPARTAIGRYTLIEMIGQGAMGQVFLALDPQLDRKVALKLVRADREPEIRTRLSREARAMAQVRHPNVVTVYDAGE